MTDKKRYPYAQAILIAEGIVKFLEIRCERIIIAGSLRRKKALVGDIEILYVPKLSTGPDPKEFFAVKTTNLADDSIQVLIDTGVLAKRKNSKGSEMFGEKNKLVVHVPTGIPVDLFSTTHDCWHNYLVCRTGPAESNTRIAMLAKAKRWRWNPYGNGFTSLLDEDVRQIVTCEADVFEFVGLPYLKPEARR